MPVGSRISTVIVDDERIARQRLRRLIATQPDLELVGECPTGHEALALLEERNVDVLFLDIQLGDLDGFHLLSELDELRRPQVVFVTAHSEHALQAFDVEAVDYLLKPFDRERFQRCVQKVREHVRKLREDSPARAVAAARNSRSYPERFAIRANGRVYFLRTEDIDWIEAADNYVILHTGQETHILRETMNSIELRLDPDRFVRVHRSRIVNMDRIRELQSWFHGEYVIILQDGTNLTLSRGYRERLLDLLHAG